jgi:D-glucosaminate-specific PTS system IIB component
MATQFLARIDSRLIHGQVVAKWLKTIHANHIIVIDDSLAKNSFMSNIYSMAAPPGCKVTIVTIEKALEQWNSDHLGIDSNSTIMLFKDVKTALSVWQQGLKLTQLQVGGLGAGPDRKTVFKNITLNAKDAADLALLSNCGVNIIFQTVPEDTPNTLKTILNGVSF